MARFLCITTVHLQTGDIATCDQLDAYVVVYSVEDRKSFATAMQRLREIRSDEGRPVAVILVANKTDLVRRRVVPEIGEFKKVTTSSYKALYTLLP